MPDAAVDGSPPPIKLAVCVVFHYVEERLAYLDALCANFPRIAREIDVTVVANPLTEVQRSSVLALGARHGLALSVFCPTGLGHPYLLPWSHFAVIREKFLDASYTHFLYQEDDLLVRAVTVRYLLEARETLRPAGLLPAIVRVERKSPEGEWYATDAVEPIALKDRRMVISADAKTGFIQLDNAYQGMYFLDRECMKVHLEGDSSSPDFGAWAVRERASQGLTFTDRPEGFKYRCVVPVDLASEMLDERCLVHHLPNNYALDPRWRYGKLPVHSLSE